LNPRVATCCPVVGRNARPPGGSRHVEGREAWVSFFGDASAVRVALGLAALAKGAHAEIDAVVAVE